MVIHDIDIPRRISFPLRHDEPGCFELLTGMCNKYSTIQ